MFALHGHQEISKSLQKEEIRKTFSCQNKGILQQMTACHGNQSRSSMAK